MNTKIASSLYWHYNVAFSRCGGTDNTYICEQVLAAKNKNKMLGLDFDGRLHGIHKKIHGDTNWFGMDNIIGDTADGVNLCFMAAGVVCLASIISCREALYA